MEKVLALVVDNQQRVAQMKIWKIIQVFRRVGMIFRLSKYLSTSMFYCFELRIRFQIFLHCVLIRIRELFHVYPDPASGSGSIICIRIRIPKDRWIRICSASNVCG